LVGRLSCYAHRHVSLSKTLDWRSSNACVKLCRPAFPQNFAPALRPLAKGAHNQRRRMFQAQDTQDLQPQELTAALVCRQADQCKLAATAKKKSSSQPSMVVPTVELFGKHESSFLSPAALAAGGCRGVLGRHSSRRPDALSTRRQESNCNFSRPCASPLTQAMPCPLCAACSREAQHDCPERSTKDIKGNKQTHATHKHTPGGRATCRARHSPRRPWRIVSTSASQIVGLLSSTSRPKNGGDAPTPWRNSHHFIVMQSSDLNDIIHRFNTYDINIDLN
jgi:hypothetical protein